MGYSTTFEGTIEINPPLSPELGAYINLLAATRRMKRDPAKLKDMYNGEHGFNGNYGIDGEFFARVDGEYGQSKDDSITYYNSPPRTQPGLWLQWTIPEGGQFIEWDGGEKFYEADKWLEYIIDKIISPAGHVCNGVIECQGEDASDRWDIEVVDNKVKIVKYDFVRRV